MKLDFATFRCSIARTLDHIEPSWTPLILRDVFYGLCRFDQLNKDLGIASNVLASRLEALVEKGILERVAYRDRPRRHEYRPTRKGAELFPVLLGMMRWGDVWAGEPSGPPVRVRHASCGRQTTPEIVCQFCGEPLTLDNVSVHAGPSARASPGTALVGELAASPAPQRPRTRLRERFDQALVATLEAMHLGGARYRKPSSAVREARKEHRAASAFRLACENETREGPPEVGGPSDARPNAAATS